MPRSAAGLPSVPPLLRSARPLPFLVLLPALLLPGGCADGGLEERPQSEVRIAANHHLFWFRSLPGFGTFPVRADTVFPGRATFRLADDSTYSLTLPSGGTTSPDRYALARDGELSVFFVGSGREPSVVFRGGYRLVGDQPDLFFTDRVSQGSSPSLGLYFGTRSVPGQVELEGGWHLLSLHVRFAQGQLTVPRNVGRAAHGAVSVAAGAPGEVRTVSGTGMESGSDPAQVAVTFGGSIQNLLSGGSGDGSVNLTVDYTVGGVTEARVFRAAAGKDLVLAVDEEESDGAAGLLFLVRKFDAPATPADPAQIAGEYLLGGHTLFVNPANSGSDAFFGRLQLTEQGGFQLDAEGHQGIAFGYTGTFAVAADGGLTLTVGGTNETWFAAINRAYDTVVLVDAVVENRANNAPELNLAVGVRKKPE